MHSMLDTVWALIKTRDDLSATAKHIEQLRLRVDTAINTLMNFLEELKQEHGNASGGEDVERSMVDDVCSKGEEFIGAPSNDKIGESI